MRRFPEGFRWGCATSSYQIEGGVDMDGRGESIWDRFAAQPGRIEDGSSGAQACEHYLRWRDDVDLMAEIGVGTYRFSIAWPRVLPQGTGTVNEAGLDFYEQLVDRLLERGIQPMVTLYHWDLPQVLQDAGGWPVRRTMQAFVDYAEVVARRLGDRVKDWITHNEPWCISVLGHLSGEHAPGHKDLGECLATAHHVLMSHGLAVPVIRAHSPGAEVGLAVNLVDAMPASNSRQDVEASRSLDGSFNRWFLDPLYGRGYPEDVIADHLATGELPGGMDFVRAGDLAHIATATDFLGVNYYSRAVMRSDAIPEAQNFPRTVTPAPKEEWTDMGWEVYPDGLRSLLVRLHHDYGASKLYVTENGAAYDTGPDGEGRVRDVRRVRYLHDHIAAVQRAIDEGANVAGYYVWSLFDNFEWGFGYAKRFGIVHVDYETQRRTFKDSARWYQKTIAAHGVASFEESS